MLSLFSFNPSKKLSLYTRESPGLEKRLLIRVIVMSNCIVGFGFPIASFFTRPFAPTGAMRLDDDHLFFIGYEVAPEIESLLCRVALWEGFECAIASFIGCYQVA